MSSMHPTLNPFIWAKSSISSSSLNRVLDWSRGDRLEIDGSNGRSILLFQPDRKVLIRSSETGRTA